MFQEKSFRFLGGKLRAKKLNIRIKLENKNKKFVAMTYIGGVDIKFRGNILRIPLDVRVCDEMFLRAVKLVSINVI